MRLRGVSMQCRVRSRCTLYLIYYEVNVQNAITKSGEKENLGAKGSQIYHFTSKIIQATR